jgi:hypothetical protein
MKLKYNGFKVFNKKFIIFVFLMVAFSTLDVYYTIVLINTYGVFGERSPIASFLFKAGLIKLWLIINPILGFIAVLAFFLFINYLQGIVKYFALNLFALLLTIKILISIRYICFFHFSVNPSLINLGILIFMLTIFVLMPKQKIAKFFKEILNILSDLILIFISPRFKTEFKMKAIVKQDKKEESKLKNKKLWISLATVILCPFITLSLLQLFWRLSKIQETPKWLKSLGIVTQIQGALYIASFILIIVMLTIMIYSVTVIFEVFAQSNKIDATSKKMKIFLLFNLNKNFLNL